METQMADVTIHIDETMDSAKLEGVRDKLLAETGVMAASFHKEKPHLMIVEYDPDKNNSGNLLKAVTKQGVHAELIGL
jgi:hypothetical protein